MSETSKKELTALGKARRGSKILLESRGIKETDRTCHVVRKDIDNNDLEFFKYNHLTQKK